MCELLSLLPTETIKVVYPFIHSFNKHIVPFTMCVGSPGCAWKWPWRRQTCYLAWNAVRRACGPPGWREGCVSQAGKGVVCGGFVGWMMKGLSWKGDPQVGRMVRKRIPKRFGLESGQSSDLRFSGRSNSVCKLTPVSTWVIIGIERWGRGVLGGVRGSRSLTPYSPGSLEVSQSVLVLL